MPVDPKPEPVVTGTACSLCGLDWRAHGDDPTPLDCIRLLKADAVRQVQEALLVRRRPAVPYPIQPVQPWSPRPARPHWQSPFICTSSPNQSTTSSPLSVTTMLLNAPNVEECSAPSANPAGPFGI